MKKRQLILDFTSLLDVIMILLFIVLGNMSRLTTEAEEEAKAAVAESQIQVEQLSEEKETMTAEIEELRSQIQQDAEAETALVEAEKALAELEGKYNSLQEDYDYLKITTEFNAEDTKVYEMVIERMTKLVVICEAVEDEKNKNPQVELGIYVVDTDSEEQTYAGAVYLEHDLSLLREERIRVYANQVTEVTKAFADALRKDSQDIIWFSVQYAYDDANVSNVDLSVIQEAARNLERSFSKTCFVEKIKIY